MKRSTAGGRRLPFRRMMAIGRTRPPIASGTAPSIRISTSLATAGRGRMLTPAAMAIACLMVSMLSNCMTTSTRTPARRSTPVDGPADGQVVVEGDERLALEIGRLGGSPASEPVARVEDEHHGLLAERQHLERATRRGVREDAEVDLVAEDRLDHLVRVQALQEDARVGVHRHEGLHVAAHVVKPDRVDRGHPDGALHALPGRRQVGPGPLEACQEGPARLVEASPLLRRLDRPPGAVQQLDVELGLELLDRLARGGLGHPALGAAPGDAPESHDVAEELERLDLHGLQLTPLEILMQ